MQDYIFANSAAIHDTGKDAASMMFLIQLASPPTAPVTVKYRTEDVKAVAGRDYDATSGVLTFNPGEIAKPIVVPVLPYAGPQPPPPSQGFDLVLSDAEGATLLSNKLTGTIWRV